MMHLTMDGPRALAGGEARAADAAGPACAALVKVLHQLAEVIASLSEGEYTAPLNGNGSSGIGAHVLHCLDHVTTLLSGVRGGVIDYDARERGTAIERDRHLAFGTIERLEAAVTALATADPQQPVRVRAMVSGAGPTMEVPSTLGRELLYVLSHTIHHNAILATAVKVRGVSVPQGFGYAPSTIAFLRQSACVPSPWFG